MGYGPSDDRLSEQLLNEALDTGYTLLDTAALYGQGHNEKLIGNTLKPRRQEYVLASKGGLQRSADGKTVINGSPDALKANCEDSLKRLQTDVIDLYYLHRLDPGIPIEESVGALADLIHAGKVRAIGLSEVSSFTLRRANAVHPVTAVQSEYSLWTRTPEANMLKTCEQLGVTFVAFAPLGRGFLAGTAEDITRLQEYDHRCHNARPRFEPEAFSQNTRLLITFEAIAARVGCSMAQLALAWILAQQDSTGDRTIIPIPGTKHKNYALENAGASKIALDCETLVELNTLINEHSVSGRRYTDSLMATIDSEKDRI